MAVDLNYEKDSKERIPYEHYLEIDKTNNHYNCPIVTSYAENIKNNVELLMI